MMEEEKEDHLSGGSQVIYKYLLQGPNRAQVSSAQGNARVNPDLLESARFVLVLARFLRDSLLRIGLQGRSEPWDSQWDGGAILIRQVGRPQHMGMVGPLGPMLAGFSRAWPNRGVALSSCQNDPSPFHCYP